MSKTIHPRRRGDARRARSPRTLVPARSTPAAATSRTADDQLARLVESPNLPALVPGLPPETVHLLIRRRGLDACADIVAAATPEQLIAVLDIDLWQPARAGQDAELDADRFGEWLELLEQAGDGEAARILASLERDVVIAGLSRHIKVFDPATLTAANEDAVAGSRARRIAGAEPPQPDGTCDLTFEVGGYVVRPTRDDAWDAILALLVDLETRDPECFHAVMRGCRALSNSAPEIDGLDELLGISEQLTYAAAAARAERRRQHGYVAPADARAFLQMARRPREVMAQHSPARGLTSRGSRLALIRSVLEAVREADESVFATRTEQLAFLANVLISGCSVQARAFTPEEASQAALAICNLGLEHSPGHASAVDRDLVTAFEVGWSVLYQQVCLFTASHVVALAGDLQSLDSYIEEGLRDLGVSLARACRRGTPWDAREALEIVTMLDQAVWASLRGLLDECPVIPAALAATAEGRTGGVSATAFEFISTAGQIGEVHAFVRRLRDLLLR